MTADPEVLIISTAVDVATDDVVRLLRERGARIVRVNTEDLPFDQAFSIQYGPTGACEMAFGDQIVRPHSIWYRRLRTPSKPDTMDEGVYDFCIRENRAALLGGLLAQDVRWLSHPAAIWQAEFKSYQLQAARATGLAIPRTLISNDPSAIKGFYSDIGRMIVKPARSGHFWRGGEEYSVYTSEVREEDIGSIEDARLTPSIYQELVPKDVDIRATYVGGKLFSAEIHSQTDPAASVDWRQTDNPLLPHKAVQLPAALAAQLQLLMVKLGLTFGCIDLVRKPDGAYVFLEVNPSGQWLWIDEQLNLGISSAVADWLVSS